MAIGKGDDGKSGGRRFPLAQTVRPDQPLRYDPESDSWKPSMTGSLVVLAGVPADIGTHVVVQGPVVIGREEEGLQLRDSQISRRHASVTKEGEKYVLHDLGSTNGTLVNGTQVVGERALQEGDRIHVGISVIKFTLIDDTEAAYLKRMQRLAGVDELTGLPAKHRFDSLLAAIFRTAHAGQMPLSLLMMDMDGLKAINDAHGHQMGAHTISEVGRIIGRHVAGHGEACRFGGDEFCAYLFGSSPADACAIAERIRHEVEGTIFTLEQSQVRASISIGVAHAGAALASPETLTAAADQALYRAKARGRNVVSE